MKQELINKLQSDLEKLIEKHSNFIEKNDFGTALNVMKNIDHINSQLKNIDYETLVSKYSTSNSGKRIELISIWKQNAFGDIKDHETYVIKEKYKSNTYDALEELSNNWSTMSDEEKENVYKLFGTKDKYVSEQIIENYNKQNWYDILKFFVETKQSQLIQLDYTSNEKQMIHRGTGKTTALLKLSNDYNIPILVKSYEKEHNELEKIANKFGFNISVVDTRMLNMKQYEKIDILLVDENIDMNSVVLRGSDILKTIIGFSVKR